MPDANSKLSPADLAAINGFLASKIPGGWTCPYCRSKTYWVGVHVKQTALYPSPQTSARVPPQTWPFVEIICTTCNHVALFATGMMGLYPKPEKRVGDASA